MNLIAVMIFVLPIIRNFGRDGCHLTKKNFKHVRNCTLDIHNNLNLNCTRYIKFYVKIK